MSQQGTPETIWTRGTNRATPQRGQLLSPVIPPETRDFTFKGLGIALTGRPDRLANQEASVTEFVTNIGPTVIKVTISIEPPTVPETPAP